MIDLSRKVPLRGGEMKALAKALSLNQQAIASL